MHFLKSLVLGLLPSTVFAAKKPAAESFEEFHTKAQASSPLKLTDSIYEKLTASPRDYASAILLTALEPRLGCQLCREFQPEWELLSKSWTKGDKTGQSRLIFGTLDFSDGKGTFQSLSLTTAPVLLFFPPTTGPDAVADAAPLRYDFSNGPQIAEQVHSWIAGKLPNKPHPAVYRPINWLKIITVTTTALGTIAFIAVAWPYIKPVLQSRNLWAAFSLIAILLFTSGHMFNHIRKVPYVVSNGHGGVSYFAGSFQNQYGMETQIVAFMYGLLSFATISLALKVPRIANPGFQQIAVLIWTGVIFLMYSFLLSVFRIKNGGYPFWLPPFN